MPLQPENEVADDEIDGEDVDDEADEADEADEQFDDEAADDVSPDVETSEGFHDEH